MTRHLSRPSNPLADHPSTQRKQVFGSHYQLARRYLDQTHEIGRSSDNRMFFIGPALYSYGKHYTLAFIDKATDTVLINSTKRSVSTAKHKHCFVRARWDDDSGRNSFAVPCPDIREPAAHARNVKALLDEVLHVYKWARRCGGAWSFTDRKLSLENACDRLGHYRQCYSLGCPDDDPDLDALFAEIEQCEVRYQSPQRVAARERAKARKILREQFGGDKP